MFTGIVETIGTISSVKPFDTSETGGSGYAVEIADAAPVLGDCKIGDSIAVNGVCLTVTEFTSTQFKVGIAPETLSRTNLGALQASDKVNLERAVTGETRLGGHVVQGHVDTTAKIVARKPDENSVRLTFRPKDLSVLKYVVEKGFIALEGASLTVTGVDATTFSVMLIAHTQKAITLGSKQIGDEINVEVDLTGKLIEKQVEAQVNRLISGPGLLTPAVISAGTAALVVLGFNWLRK